MKLSTSLSIAAALAVGAGAAMASLKTADGGRPNARVQTVPRPDPRETEIPTARRTPVTMLPESLAGRHVGMSAGLPTGIPGRLPASQSGARELAGNVIYGGYRMASLSLASYTLDTLLDGVNGEFGSVYYDGKYLVLTPGYDQGELSEIYSTVYDPADWSQIGTTGSQENFVRAFDLTYDTTTRRIYGCFNTFDNKPYFGYMAPPADGSVQLLPVKITDVTEVWNGIAATSAGELYAITKSGVLNKIDKNTGAMTRIGDTGVATRYLCSATADDAAGVIYYTPNTDSYSRLYAIDMKTATATRLCDIPGYAELIGTYIPAPRAQDKAPDAVTGLRLTFPGTSLSGKVNFNAPALLYDGTAATGNLTYTLTVGDKTFTGTAASGAAVEVDVTLDAPGMYTFSVFTANTTGQGPARSMTAYIGPDTPEAPTSAKAAYDNATSQMTVTWKAPTQGINGTTLSPDALTYTLKAFPSGRTIDGITGTTYTETVAMPEQLTDFHYTVTAVCGTFRSAPATTNTVTIGTIVPPYANSFKLPGDLDGCTIIDANRDFTTWEYTDNYGGCVKVRYDVTHAMNDWLLLPAMRLSAGKSYKVTCRAGTNDSSLKERIEVCAGTEPTAEAMTLPVIAPTELSLQFKNGGEILEGHLVAPADGIYYIGFHGISDKDRYWLCLGDVEVAAGLNVGTPGMATDLTVTPDMNGALTADIAFTTPAVDNNGNPLAAISRIDLTRDGELLHSFRNPATGSRLTYTDNAATNGAHTYAVQGFNAAGAGMTASVISYVGYDVPSALPSLTASRGDNNGSMELTWTAPETDINGKRFSAGALTYTVMRIEGEEQTEVASGLTETDCMLQAVPENATQRFVQYAVFPRSVAGYGEGLPTGLVPVGAPYTIPMVESWSGKALSNIWGFDGTGGVMLVDGYYFDNVPAQDNDDGYLLIYGDFKDDTVNLISGNIAIPADAGHPRLTYYYFGMSGCLNTLESQISADGVNFTTLDSSVLSAEKGKDVWTRVTVPLDAYKGQTVQLRFKAVRDNMKYIMLDNIRVFDQVAHDLANVELSVPATVEAGQPVGITVSYENIGTETATGVNVLIYRNDELVATVPAGDIKDSATGAVTYSDITDPVMPARLTYKAVVDYAADLKPENNSSAPATVTLTYPEYPVATALAAARTGNDVTLTWEAPDLEKRPYIAETETFDGCESFTGDEFAGWTSVKLDNGKNGSIEGVDIPGIVPGQSAKPFFVFDTSVVPDSPGYTHFMAHSGDKYLAVVYNDDANEPLDVLLVSPRLCGDAQTVTFWAKSCLSLFPESMEVLYSTTGTEPGDFTGIALDVYAVAGDWTEYSARVPEGAVYMAIRATSADKYMLMIDDITARLATSPRLELTVKGYNVYRDSKRVNSETVAATGYTDSGVGTGAQTYVVTVVYDLGESLPSERATAPASVDNITDDAITVRARNGVITIDGADDLAVTVNTPDGRTVYAAAHASVQEAVTVAPGIYIVTAGSQAYKVMTD